MVEPVAPAPVAALVSHAAVQDEDAFRAQVPVGGQDRAGRGVDQHQARPPLRVRQEFSPPPAVAVLLPAPLGLGGQLVQGGPGQFSLTDRQRFASSLDRLLTRMLRESLKKSPLPEG